MLSWLLLLLLLFEERWSQLDNTDLVVLFLTVISMIPKLDIKIHSKQRLSSTMGPVSFLNQCFCLFFLLVLHMIFLPHTFHVFLSVNPKNCAQSFPPKNPKKICCEESKARQNRNRQLSFFSFLSHSGSKFLLSVEVGRSSKLRAEKVFARKCDPVASAQCVEFSYRS